MIHPSRIRRLNDRPPRSGPVIYWMSRDQRVEDNWALLYARRLAEESGEPLIVLFCPVPSFLGASIRQYGFMIKGLQEIEESLKQRNISFYLMRGQPKDAIPVFLAESEAGALVCDFSPLKLCRSWKKWIAGRIEVPLYEVDAHNIVPCWAASPKKEFGAYTIRPKIQRVLDEFLVEFPALKGQNLGVKRNLCKTDWQKLSSQLSCDMSVPEVGWIASGESKARAHLNRFLREGLARYDDDRNDPSKDGQSNLSPFLHFGQISAQRVALEVKKSVAPKDSKESFLEELIVRRELADNYCFYEKDYDSTNGFPNWARETLKRHEHDDREYFYGLKTLEKGKTHDDLWNAAQLQMVTTGKMHGYMRMYWAKKLLEWTRSPKEALKTAIFLNDKYELDGRDPNGYAGIAWSIGGLHDRAWGEREIFGKVRFMSRNGARAKFDIEKYVNQAAQ